VIGLLTAYSIQVAESIGSSVWIASVVEMRQLLLTIGVTSTSRVLILRDRILGRIGRDRWVEGLYPGVSRHTIQSGKNVLDAVLVMPDSGAVTASLLICHGIGETVQHWIPVQQLLAASGVASLVFDYSGYGRSSGFFNANQSEMDAVSAFQHLQELTAPLPVSVLGFSLGSGIAPAIISRVPVHRLMLCAAFTSLRKAAVSAGVPRLLAFAVPPIWDAKQTLRNSAIPLLVVQGDADRLFSVEMAAELASYSGAHCEFVTVQGLTHNEPFYRPESSYWSRIAAWLQ
jgi:alpha-beta hydrolase superfamily lysophospholipase